MNGRRGAARIVLIGLVILLPAGPSRMAGQPSGPSAGQFHEVRRGDTLKTIAERYGVTVAALLAANQLSGSEATLRLGQRLVIPSPRPASPPAAGTTPRRAKASVALQVPTTLVLAVPDFGDLVPLFAWPLDGPVSSTFGRRRRSWHRGIDIQGELGVPIMASAPGVVGVSGVEPRYGRVVKIEHPHGFMTVYAHNDQNIVEIGDRVSTGQTIGLVGRTGRATAHHLHFEIRHAGLTYNPLYLLPLPSRGIVDDTLDIEPEDPDE